MKPKVYVLMVMILLVGTSMVGGALAVRAQSSADAPASAGGNYLLPLVMGSSYDIPTPTPTPSPTPTPTPSPTPARATQIKSKSGIHMGNRSSDWNPAYFARIGYNSDGAWPAAVVVQSNQLFDYVRQADDQCRISSASVKQTDGKEYELYRYLTEGIRYHNVKVVIRISPSPGNFDDFADPGDTHVLLAGETPAGGDYCGDAEAQKAKALQYRDILDIAKEMAALYDLNVNKRDWPAENLFFEPANEPNKEWYQEFVDGGVANLDPKVDNKRAWIDMDEYFAALYDRAKQPDLNPNLQILSPSMAQGLYGEHFGLGTCDSFTVVDGGERSGFDFLKKVYGYDFAAPTQPPARKADGFSLHNYWRQGKETWDGSDGGVSHDFICDYPNGISNYQPPSDHISQYFPDAMAVSMRLSGKPIFITEADLLAPCPQASSALITKDRVPGDATDYPGATRDSILAFIRAESWASHVISWLLVNQFTGETTCDTNSEINWHEAYLENGQEREWFGLWWPETP